MKKITLYILAFYLLSISCLPNPGKSLEEQQRDLDILFAQASIIHDEAVTKSGQEYLDCRDKYFATSYKRAKMAVDYAQKFTLDYKTEDDIRRKALIADVAKNEWQVAMLFKEDFDRFPPSKTLQDVVLSYFNNAYALEPATVEKYIDFSLFKPTDELYCYAMLSLGFAEQGNTSQAKKYFDKTSSLLGTLASDPAAKRVLPLVYVAGLRAYIAARIGDREKAFQILAEAKNELTGKVDQDRLAAYHKMLGVLGNKAPELETGHWVGTDKPLAISELQGKIVILYFFTWDNDECSLDNFFLARLQKEVGSENLMVIGATGYTGKYEHEQTLSEEAEFRYLKDHYTKKRNVQWPISMSKTSIGIYGIDTVPTFVLIDKNGLVKAGYFISNFSHLKNEIELLLKEK